MRQNLSWRDPSGLGGSFWLSCWLIWTCFAHFQMFLGRSMEGNLEQKIGMASAFVKPNPPIGFLLSVLPLHVMWADTKYLHWSNMPQPKWWKNSKTNNHMKTPSLGNKWKLVAAAEQMIERWQKGVCPIVRQTDCGWLVHIHALHCIWLYCQGGQTWCQSMAHYEANIPIRNNMETFEQSLPFQMG